MREPGDTVLITTATSAEGQPPPRPLPPLCANENVERSIEQGFRDRPVSQQALGPLPGLRAARLAEPSLRFMRCLRAFPFPDQTLYNVKAEILPPAGTEHCRTGSLCSLAVSITRLSDLLEVDRDEALTESDQCFSTKLMYEGRSGGFFVSGRANPVSLKV